MCLAASQAEPPDECEGVSLLPVCFVSASFLFDAALSVAHRRRVTSHPLRRRSMKPQHFCLCYDG